MVHFDVSFLTTYWSLVEEVPFCLSAFFIHLIRVIVTLTKVKGLLLDKISIYIESLGGQPSSALSKRGNKWQNLFIVLFFFLLLNTKWARFLKEFGNEKVEQMSNTWLCKSLQICHAVSDYHKDRNCSQKRIRWALCIQYGGFDGFDHFSIWDPLLYIRHN